MICRSQKAMSFHSWVFSSLTVTSRPMQAKRGWGGGNPGDAKKAAGTALGARALPLLRTLTLGVGFLVCHDLAGLSLIVVRVAGPCAH